MGQGGVPAVSAAQRLVANDVSLLPLMVYRELDQDGNAEKARDTWQWALFHQQPEAGLPAMRFWFNVAMGILNRGNSYALKLRDGRQVAALQYMSGRVECRQQQGVEVYDWTRPDGTMVRGLGVDRVVHWPGPSFDGSGQGMSVLQLHRATVDTAWAQEQYRRAFYTNGARADLVVKHPGVKNEEQADEWIAKHESRHRGVLNARRPMILPADADVEVLNVSFEDAQYVESQRFTVEDIERIFLFPPGTLQEPASGRPDPERKQRYLQQAILPLTGLIEGVLEADADFFGAGSNLYPEFLTAGLQRADISARYEAYLKGRQAGWLSVNDIRAMENLPPIPEGDDYQTTPVGGAPNLQPTTEPAADEAT